MLHRQASSNLRPMLTALALALLALLLALFPNVVRSHAAQAAQAVAAFAP